MTMHYNQIGTTGTDVSDIVCGTYKAGGRDWGAVNDLDSVATIQHCVDRGVNLIDTATGYGSGRAERLISYALDDGDGARRGKTRIMTKWFLWGRPDEQDIRSVSPEMQAQFLVGSQKRLGVEKIDMVLLHRDDTVTPIEEAIEALAGFQQAGSVGMIGASNYTLAHLQRAQATAPLQNYQPSFSMLDTAVRDDGRLDFCRENAISVGVFGVLGRGLLVPALKSPDDYASWDHRRQVDAERFARRQQMHGRLRAVAERYGRDVAQLAIAWVLSHPGVTFAIVGASTPAQADQLLAASGWRLEQDVIDECESIVREANP
jgi:aryl-alcohol dehydrogenase-like predicted oxidoreductase